MTARRNAVVGTCAVAQSISSSVGSTALSTLADVGEPTQLPPTRFPPKFHSLCTH